jgi:hypothetical protein
MSSRVFAEAVMGVSVRLAGHHEQQTLILLHKLISI